MKCPHQSECPGCPALDLDYAAQLDAKRARAARALARFPRLAALEVSATNAAEPTLGYRTRAKLAVERGAIGLYRAGTHEVVDSPGCVALAPVVADAVTALRGASLGPEVLAIDVREARENGVSRALVTLVVDEATALDVASVAAPDLAIATRSRKSPRLLGGAPRVARGAATTRDEIEPGAPFALASHGSFVQAHRGTAAQLHRAIEVELASLPNGSRVMELHAGSCALALRLARRFRVLAVESFEPAIAQASEAAHAQSLDGFSGRAGDAATIARQTQERFAAVLVNPPRRGIDPPLRDAIGRMAPDKLLYVACDPETLARDLDALAVLGMHATRAIPFDMMPQTFEVETLVALERGAPAPPRVLHEDDDLVVVDKDPHEPTTPQGEHGGSLLARVRALGHRDAVPLHRLDAGTSGVCVFVKSGKKAAPYAAMLADCEKEYVALVRGIARDKGHVRRNVDGKTAHTRYVRERVVGGHSLLRVLPSEGRRHQIRKHLASIDHPVLGDARYGHPQSNKHFAERHTLDRTFLHARRLVLGKLEVTADLAPDLALVLERLERGHVPIP